MHARHRYPSCIFSFVIRSHHACQSASSCATGLPQWLQGHSSYFQLCGFETKLFPIMSRGCNCTSEISRIRYAREINLIQGPPVDDIYVWKLEAREDQKARTKVNGSYFRSQWAFNTTEPLEHILLQLPTVGIHLSQRVCSRRREVIMAFVALRRLLFLSPVPKQISQASTSSNSMKPGYNGSGLSLMPAGIGGQSRRQRSLNPFVAKLFNINPMRFNRSNRGQSVASW